MNRIIAFHRFILFFWMFYKDLNKIRAKNQHWKNNDETGILLRTKQSLFRRVRDMMRLRVHSEKEVLPDTRKIFISNHRTWCDIIAIMSEFPCIGLAKAEVRKTAIIGEWVDRTGSIFVKREDNSDRYRALREMEQVLKEGHSLLVFPEGTTHFNGKTLPFNEGIFLLAAKLDIPIVPINIEYSEKSLDFVGKETFFSNFIKNFHRPSIDVFVRYSSPIQGNNRRTLIAETQSVIDRKMDELKRHVTWE